MKVLAYTIKMSHLGRLTSQKLFGWYSQILNYSSKFTISSKTKNHSLKFTKPRLKSISQMLLKCCPWKIVMITNFISKIRTLEYWKALAEKERTIKIYRGAFKKSYLQSILMAWDHQVYILNKMRDKSVFRNST